MGTLTLPKFYKTAIHFVLSVAIATQSLYMFQPSRAEAKPSKAAVVTTCLYLLTAVSGFGGGAMYMHSNIATPIVTTTASGTITRDAHDVVKVARETPLSAYLGKSPNPTPAQVARLRSAFNELTYANMKLYPDMLPSSELFLTWVSQHQADLIASDRPLEDSFSLQDYFHASAAVYVADVTNAAKNPRVFTSWVEKTKSYDGVTEKEMAIWLMALSMIGGFALGTLKSAIIFGPITGSFNAWVEKPVTAIQQILKVKGIKHWGWLFRLIQKYGFRTEKPKELRNLDPNEQDTVQTADEIIAAERQKVAGTQSSVMALKKHLASMGVRANQARAFEYQENQKEVYIAFATVWGSFLGDSLRDGRALKWDGMYFRPRDFALHIRMGLANSNGYMTTFEGLRNTLVGEHPENRLAIIEIMRSLPAIAKTHVSNQIRNPKVAVEKLAELDAARLRLIELGAEEAQAERVIDTIIYAYSERRAATFNLLNFIRHDIEYREFREQIPAAAYRELLRNRHGLGIDQAMKSLRNDILDITDELSVQLAMYDEHLNLLSGLSRIEKEAKVKELGPKKLGMSELEQGLPASTDNMTEAQKKSAWIYLKSFGRAVRDLIPTANKSPNQPSDNQP